MPLSFIPNQPFIFEKPIGDYPCLNNDPKAYAQLVQDGDITCVQWILEACDEPICEPNMAMETPGPDELGAWTTGTGWSSTGSDNLTFAYSAGSFHIASNMNMAINLNKVYCVKFDVTNITGTIAFNVYTSLVQNFLFTETGSYQFYFIADSDDLYFNISNPTAAESITIENIEYVQWTDCWEDELPLGDPTWTYSYDGANGKFCSLITDDGDLTNTTAFINTGNHHGVTLVIDSCSQGGLEVRLGSVLLGTTSGNGSFDFYGTPTAGTDLVFTKVGNFDGCVSQVNVLDYGDVGTAAVTVRSENNFYKADGLTPTPFNDRLVQCIDWENLSWNINGVPNDCIPLLVDIKDPCDNDVVYASINRALLKSGGATWECTKLVEAWNDGYAFDFYFGDIASPDFKLTQRLRVLQFNPVYRNVGEEYLYSSGNSGRSFAQSQKARTAWFDYMDEYAHDCTRTQLLSQKLFVEGYAFYFPTEDYEPEWNENGKYNLAQSRVTLFHEEAIFGSPCGVMANTVCPPQVIQLPPALTQVQVLMDEFDLSTCDSTNAELFGIFYDENGVVVTTSSNIYDLTDSVDRAAFAAQVGIEINTFFGTTTTTATCTLTGILFSINVVCSGAISIPMKSLTLNVLFVNCYPLGLPLYYS